jgi:cytochrome P450
LDLICVKLPLAVKPGQADSSDNELKTIVLEPENLTKWSALGQLPCLTAVILEGLCVSYATAPGLARIAPDEALFYDGIFKDKQYSYAIPPASAISILTQAVHNDENIFTNPYEFLPERWLTPNGARRTDLEKFLMSFSKASRNCLGIK